MNDLNKKFSYDRNFKTTLQRQFKLDTGLKNEQP